MGNDDQVFMTLGWDRKYRKAAEAFDDDIYVMWHDDGINADRHCAFPCVSRRWVNTLGYFSPVVGFKFFYNDTWVYDLGQKVGRCHYLPDVLLQHHHHSKGGVRDETTAKNRREGQSAHDKDLWDKTEGVRRRDANKLRELMK
jgi:hypothetical protein